MQPNIYNLSYISVRPLNTSSQNILHNMDIPLELEILNLNGGEKHNIYDNIKISTSNRYQNKEC
jgi:hypothetical protein